MTANTIMGNLGMQVEGQGATKGTRGPVRVAIQVMVLGVLFSATGAAFAKKLNAQPNAQLNAVDGQATTEQDFNERASDGNVWRCSLDGKYYTVNDSNGLQISAIGSGQITANIPLRTDKKGRSKLEGQWDAGGNSGLIVIQGKDQGSVSGHMLVPIAGAPPAACNSRKAAVIFSIGQPQPVCNVVSIRWNLQAGVTAAQVADEEMGGDNRVVNARLVQTESGGPASAVDGSLVGTWSNETATAVSYVKTRLTLRADGTYTKTFGARPPTMGGGVIGAPTWGDTHSGTWSSAGTMQVRLSGDSQHTPYMQDLRLLTRH